MNHDTFVILVFGTFKDIPASSFFSVQLDTEYRKSWDNLVIKLDIVDKEIQEDEDQVQSCQNTSMYDSKNEIVHWIMHYPVSF